MIELTEEQKAELALCILSEHMIYTGVMNPYCQTCAISKMVERSKK
jgi:hypothetical protein